MKTLFIEIDRKGDEMVDDIVESCEFYLSHKDGFRFDTIIYDAGNNLNRVWDAVLSHSHIYAATHLLYSGRKTNSYTLFNHLMSKAIEHGVSGKHIHLFSSYRSVAWYNLSGKLVRGFFKRGRNKLYTRGDNGWEEVNINKTDFNDY